MSAEYYQDISDYYNSDATDYDIRYWSNSVLQRMRQSFREETKRYPAETMLELGCGTGLDLVHFATTHPNRKIFGIDISQEMVNQSQQRIQHSGCTNVTVAVGTEQDIKKLYPEQTFDLIYVYFGALNTSADLGAAAKNLTDVLNPNGHLVLSFVNKWYLEGMALEAVRFRFSKAFARLKPVWGGYSPTKFLASKCYSPKEIQHAFSSLQLLRRKGYSIVHPAWYFTGVNKRIGRLGNVLWKTDALLNKTFLWQFGEYSLFVFKK